jgi:membrane-associated HD superfamily phosphohydrolase
MLQKIFLKEQEACMGLHNSLICIVLTVAIVLLFVFLYLGRHNKQNQKTTVLERKFYYTQLGFMILLLFCFLLVHDSTVQAIFSIHPIFMKFLLLVTEVFLFQLFSFKTENFSPKTVYSITIAWGIACILLMLEILVVLFFKNHPTISIDFHYLQNYGYLWMVTCLVIFSWSLLENKIDMHEIQEQNSGHKLTNQIVTLRTQKEIGIDIDSHFEHIKKASKKA